MLDTSTLRRTNHGEKGTALVVSMLLMMVLSVLSASMMFLAQTETASSASYRLMSQARYGAESGVHKTINYLTNTYALPGTLADPLANYDMTKSPVTLIANNQPVILSSNPAVPSNYPIAAVQTAFNGAVQGTLASGNQTVSYKASARLISMIPLVTYGGVSTVVQTWEVTAEGSVAGARSATVEVSATLEQQAVTAAAYAAFATGGGCGALNFHGNNTQTDSYTSQPGVVGGPPPAISNSGGNVGSNGNLTEGGGADIYGTLSTPRVGIGNCSAGNVSALSSSGGATVNGHNPPQPGDILQLPQTVTLPPPTVPAGVPTGVYSGNGQFLLDGASVGDVRVTAGSTLTLGATGVTSTINVNSLTMVGNAELKILGTVILNVVGTGQATPVDFTGGSVTNLSFDPTTFQVLYAGTGEIKLNGGANTTALIYAPNAAASFNGGGHFYGAVVANTIDDTGGAKIHYDTRLSSELFVAGNRMLTGFTWKKY
jgi:Tfp pilus assembly protein PilX